MQSSLEPIIGLSSYYNNIIDLNYFNIYYYARPIRHNYDIRHHFACYSAILNTSRVLIEHSCQIIITRVVSTCDPSVLMQHGKCVGRMRCVYYYKCVLICNTYSHVHCSTCVSLCANSILLHTFAHTSIKTRVVLHVVNQHAGYMVY